MAGHNKPPQDFTLSPVEFADIGQPNFEDPNKPSDTNKKIAERLRVLDRRELLLCAGQFACMAASESQPVADFKEIPAFGEGRERSRHGVTFGRLNVQTEQDPVITTFVAMKPYDRRKVDLGMRPERAVTHDWATNQHLRKLSTSGAYEPIGVWRNHDTFFVPGLITWFNERSLSLDNMLQARTDEDGLMDAATPLRARQALRLGHFGLGIAHGAHITHGDAFPQNFATDGSHIIFNDTTTLRPFGSSETTTRTKVDQDVDDFVSGTIHPEMSSPEMQALTSEALKDSEFRTDLYESYMAGAALGAERAGYPKSGLLVPPSTHQQIIDRVVQRYVPR